MLSRKDGRVPGGWAMTHRNRATAKATLLGVLALLATGDAVHAAGTAAIVSHAPGATPLIETVTSNYSGAALRSVSFTVTPKPGSKTRAMKVIYLASVLAAKGRLTATTVTVPVSFLYAGRANTVVLTYKFTDGSIASATTSFNTPSYNDPCGKLSNAIIQNDRAAIASINFDYFMLNNYCSSDAPVIVDTDGEVRWIAHTGVGGQPGLLYKNKVYTTNGGAGVNRVDLDGTIARVGDYGSIGVTYTGHHNFDPGRDGIILDVNTTEQTESVNIEIDEETGAVLNRWDLADIIRAAMRAGGDDPDGFVKPVGNDWFHNNASTYNPADNTLIMSGRETFVIAVDYDTPADGVKKIHWILGDTTKLWGQYPSLRRYTLTLPTGTLPPIGQHAVSIDRLGNLLLFDDGQGSFNQQPAGITRTYSAARSYKIDTALMTATQVYDYTRLDKFSYICGSAYEGGPGSYLVDYSQERAGFTELHGLGKDNRLVFTIKYPLTGFCGPGWNARPVKGHNFNITR